MGYAFRVYRVLSSVSFAEDYRVRCRVDVWCQRPSVLQSELFGVVSVHSRAGVVCVHRDDEEFTDTIMCSHGAALLDVCVYEHARPVSKCLLYS